LFDRPKPTADCSPSGRRRRRRRRTEEEEEEEEDEEEEEEEEWSHVIWLVLQCQAFVSVYLFPSYSKLKNNGNIVLPLSA
jgi:Fe-S oxidoreductase